MINDRAKQGVPTTVAMNNLDTRVLHKWQG